MTAGRIPKAIYSLLRSRKLAIVLLVTITLLSAFGTLIPQQSRAGDAYVAMWNEDHPLVSAINQYYDLNNIYDSWQFLTILALLGVNTFFCSLPRIKTSLNRVYGQVRFTDSDFILKLKNHHSIVVKRSATKTISDLQKILNRKGYITTQQGNQIFAEKNRYGSLSSPIFHLSLVVILLSTFYGGAMQMHGVAQIIDGQDFTEAHSNYIHIKEGPFFGEQHKYFNIHLTKFHPSYELNGKWRGFAADVLLSENGQVIKEDTIYVNNPLRYKGFSIDRNEYGFAPLFVLRSNDSISGSYIIASYTDDHQYTASFNIADTGILADVVLYPDAIVGDEIISISDFPNNPLAYLNLSKNGELIYSGPLKLNDSIKFDLDSTEMSLEFNDLEYWASFYIHRDASIPILYSALLICLLSLTAALFYIPRRIWVEIVDNDNNTTGTTDSTGITINIGGKADKKILSFKDELLEICNEIGGT
ncbi:MAG: cytochrome c biogenesis protein ResB [Methanosarcinaceae archaeon]|nr:cytochrome c biogenesis protein ResB [Methanosarcinaceae archaeon]